MSVQYKRILLKLSGEALSGDKGTGFDEPTMEAICRGVKQAHDLGVQIGIVVGGGNFWRGRSSGRMERTCADKIGMLATVMNCLAVSDMLRQLGLETSVQTALFMPQVAQPFVRDEAVAELEQGKVVLFGAGTGNPFFSTDTGAVLRASEIDADMILLAKNVDGVYNADPAIDPTAVRFDEIDYDTVLAKHLEVMDFTATSLAMECQIPVMLFALKDPQNIVRAVMGEEVGTIVH